ncbi:MAG TPA: phage portal protein, partial [Candidatus Obscuribacterales bacterium]
MRSADYAREGYQKNVVAYQAINKTADAVAAIPWIVRRANGDELTDHPLLRLIQRPNPMQSGSEFMRSLVGFYRISGNGYMERVMVGSQPREIYSLRSDRMTIKPSNTGMPAGYRYQVGSEFATWEADNRTGLSDIRHLKAFNPLDDWYGMSPLMAGAYAVDQHNESMQWMQSLLQNGAAPSGAMELAEGSLTDDQFNRLKAEIDEKYAGSQNAGRPMLLEGGLKWTQMGLSPVDVAIIETKYSAARDVSLALGVPPLLLNIPGDSTYSNYKEARLAFYEETVIPLVHYIRDELNAWLSPLFDGVELDIDLDKIPAIAEKRLELWTMADSSTDLTINEKREIKGYDAIDGGDEILVQSSMIPLSMAVTPLDLGMSEPMDDNPLAPGEERN